MDHVSPICADFLLQVTERVTLPNGSFAYEGDYICVRKGRVLTDGRFFAVQMPGQDNAYGVYRAQRLDGGWLFAPLECNCAADVVCDADLNSITVFGECTQAILQLDS